MACKATYLAFTELATWQRTHEPLKITKMPCDEVTQIFRAEMRVQGRGVRESSRVDATFELSLKAQ